MRVGAYRIPVVLQRPVDTDVGGGEIVRSYQVAGSTFAAIRLRTQQERFEDEQRRSARTYEIRLRLFPGLAGEWRIVAGSRVFRILSAVDPDLKRRHLICIAEEETA